MLVGRALEGNAGLLPHRAVHAVAADNPAAVDWGRGSVHVQCRGDAFPGWLEAQQLGRSLHATARLFERGKQQALRPVLRVHEREGIVALDFREVDRHERPVAIADPEDRHLHAGLRELCRDAQRLEDFQRARMDHARPRGLGGVAVPVDDQRVRATASKLGGQREADRAGTDDEDVDLSVHESLLALSFIGHSSLLAH